MEATRQRTNAHRPRRSAKPPRQNGRRLGCYDEPTRTVRVKSLEIDDNNIGPRTAYREKAYAAAVDKITVANPVLGKQLRDGVVPITYLDTIKVAQLPPDELVTSLDNLFAGRSWNESPAGVDEQLGQPSRDLLAYRELEKHFNTLHKQLMPAVRGKLMEIDLTIVLHLSILRVVNFPTDSHGLNSYCLPSEDLLP